MSNLQTIRNLKAAQDEAAMKLGEAVHQLEVVVGNPEANATEEDFDAAVAGYVASKKEVEAASEALVAFMEGLGIS